jgi:accessory colonization factor AcfC
VDLKKFKTSMETSMTEKYKTDPQLAIYRDNNIAIAYDYKDKAGDFLCYFICGN